MKYTIIDENKRDENGLFSGIQDLVKDVVSTPEHVGKVIGLGIGYSPIQALKYDSMVTRARKKNKREVGYGRIGPIKSDPSIRQNFMKHVYEVAGFYCEHNGVRFWEEPHPFNSNYIVPICSWIGHGQRDENYEKNAELEHSLD